MTQHPLVFLLSSFSEKEWKKFGAFLASDFFDIKSRNQLIFLYDSIDHYYHAEKQIAKRTFPSRSYLWEELKGKSPFNSAYINNLLSNLNKEAERFLAHTAYEQSNHFLQDTLLIARQRQLVKRFKHLCQKLEQELIGGKLKSEKEYFNDYEWKKEVDIFHGKTTSTFDRSAHLCAMMQDLDFSYLIGKLKLCCFLLSKKKKLDESQFQTIQLFKAYLTDYVSTLQSQGIFIPPLLIVYQQVLKIHEERTNHNIKELEVLFRKYGASMEDRDQSNIRQIVVNFYNLQINRGKESYREIQFKYYKNLHSEGLLSNSKNNINFRNYHNGVLNSLVLAKKNPEKCSVYLNWIEEFISSYGQNIYPKNYANNAYWYALGCLAFYYGNWEDAIEKAENIIQEPKDLYFYLRAYTLKIQAKIEAGQIDLHLEKIRNRFHDYVKRKKNIPSENLRMTYKNFAVNVRLLMDISRAETERKKMKIYTRLKKNLTQTQLILRKDWLLEKLQAYAIKS